VGVVASSRTVLAHCVPGGTEVCKARTFGYSPGITPGRMGDSSSGARAAMYRQSGLCQSLQDALEELEDEDILSEEMSDRVLAQFDKSLAAAFEQRVKGRYRIMGDLKTYRRCDGFWTFEGRDLRLSDTQGGDMVVDKMTLFCQEETAVTERGGRK